MFDLAVNVLAYMPLGARWCSRCTPQSAGLARVSALSIGLLLAAVIETAQSFLSTRIPSNLDLLTNTAGASLGALIAAPLASSLIDRGRLADWRLRWFERDASLMLLLIAVWPTAQIYPGPMLFGNGDVRDALSMLFNRTGCHRADRRCRFSRNRVRGFVRGRRIRAGRSVRGCGGDLAVGLAFASTMRRTHPE